MTHTLAILVCPSDPHIWDHINGWEVVAAILLIVAAWTATNIGKMYFIMKVAQIGWDTGNHHKKKRHADPDLRC